MKQKTQSTGRWRKGMFLFYIVFLAVLSVAVLLMPFGLRLADQTMVLTYIAGALFWVGLLGVIVVSVCLSVARRRDNAFSKKQPKGKSCGMFRFFQNPKATVCDVVLIVSAIGLIVTCIWAGTTIWPFPFLSLFIFSFGMHGMLNGSGYTYVKS